jgi:uncharacterized LabA/DUF88 family protein
MERSVVLIDGENVIRSWRSYCEEKGVFELVDYKKLIDKLSEGTNLLRAYFYDGVPEVIPVKKKNFHEALMAKGIQLRTRVLKIRRFSCANCKSVNERMVQKGVDVSLATDILRHAWQNTCEICIVVSGDEDYKDAIECAKDKGIKVWASTLTRFDPPLLA